MADAVRDRRPRPAGALEGVPSVRNPTKHIMLLQGAVVSLAWQVAP